MPNTQIRQVTSETHILKQKNIPNIIHRGTHVLYPIYTIWQTIFEKKEKKMYVFKSPNLFLGGNKS
jgi:hypothetical protein